MGNDDEKKKRREDKNNTNIYKHLLTAILGLDFVI